MFEVLKAILFAQSIESNIILDIKDFPGYWRQKVICNSNVLKQKCSSRLLSEDDACFFSISMSIEKGNDLGCLRDLPSSSFVRRWFCPAINTRVTYT